MLIIGALNWVFEWPPALRRNPRQLAETVEQLFFGGLDPRGPGIE